MVQNSRYTKGETMKYTLTSDAGQLLLATAPAYLDSILESIDITLPTKVRLVKAMVFPVVMYGCESWTIKKAEKKRKLSTEELMLLNCGVGENS